MNATTTNTKSTVGRLVASLALAAAVGLAALVAGAGAAAAQIDPSFSKVMQLEQGRWVVRGQIFVPDKLDRYNYVEHWVLFPGYVYPSSANGVEMKVVPSKTEIRRETEFFAQRFPEGSRYVRVLATESDTVPSTALPNLREALATTNQSSAALPLAGTWSWIVGGAGLAASAFHHRRRARR